MNVCFFTKKPNSINNSINHYIIQTANNLGLPLQNKVKDGIAIASVKEINCLVHNKQIIPVSVRIDKVPCRASFEIVNSAADENEKCFWVLPWPIENIKPRSLNTTESIRIAYIGADANMAKYFHSTEWIKYVQDRALIWKCKNSPEEWNDYSDVDIAICIRESPSSRKPATKLINAWNAGVIPIVSNDRSLINLVDNGNDCYISDATDVPNIIDDLLKDRDKLNRIMMMSKTKGQQYDNSFVKKQWLSAISKIKLEICNNKLAICRKITINGPKLYSFGDKLCAISAIRTYAKVHPEANVYTTLPKQLVSAYNDKLITYGANGTKIEFHPKQRHRVKISSPDKNYLGTYLHELGIYPDKYPKLDLPILPAMDGLTPKKYIAFQPFSNFAKNPNDSYIQFIIDMVKERRPTMPIIAVGKPMQNSFSKVDYSFMKDDVVDFLKIIQHSFLVLSPRSAAAHAAAAYLIPSFIWVPTDRENWHLDYPLWNKVTCKTNVSREILSMQIDNFLNEKYDVILG